MDFLQILANAYREAAAKALREDRYIYERIADQLEADIEQELTNDEPFTEVTK